MKLNEYEFITTPRLFLVPYESFHVARYHEWMQSSALQASTKSEPLSLEEEYEMQQTWRLSAEKLTFIILLRKIYESMSMESSSEKEVNSMIGDVNMFLGPKSFDENDTDIVAELEIMIAESGHQGKGLGREAVLGMMYYCIHRPITSMTGSGNPKEFVVRINTDNFNSIKLFSTLGFIECERNDIFLEVVLTRPFAPHDDHTKSDNNYSIDNIQNIRGNS